MDAVSEVKARTNIEDVIGEYVSLKRAGKNYKGLSPFSNEKTPSFVVSPEKQIWHDFSSGRGGDIFTFIEEVEGLDFKGALELLARKAGVDLAKFQTSTGKRSGPSKERLYEVLEQAAKFYQIQLGANKPALDYVAKKRAFKRETILEFKIGYSPDSGDALINFLQKRNFTPTEITSAGLSSRRGGRLSDMFRGRIMIPLSDQFGKVVGFTARLLADNPDAPKYINTPSTALYDKSRHIYGLHLAKKAIQKEKFSVLVEGNLDVISSHQAGVANVVATAGTALTEMQLKVLGRFSPDVRLAFDEDKAGLAATERAIPIAAKTGVQLSIVTIPSGKDPDELVRQDPEAWRQVIAKHEYALDWLIASYEKSVDVTSAVGKRQFSDAVLPVVKKLDNEIEKDHYVQKIAELLKIDPNSVRDQMKSGVSQQQTRLKQVKSTEKHINEQEAEARRTGDRLLSLALYIPNMRGHLDDLTRDMFIAESSRELFDFLKENPDFDGALEKSKDLNKISEYVKIVSLQFEELYAGVDPLELQYEAARLRSRLVELFVKDQKKQIVRQMESADESQVSRYLEQVRDLDQLLKRTKE